MSSYGDLSSFWGFPGKHHISDGERDDIFSLSEVKVRFGGLANDSKAVVSARSKRPFSDDTTDNSVLKRARKVGQDGCVDLSADFGSFISTCKGTSNSVFGQDYKAEVSDSISSSLSWFRHLTPEEHRFESPIRLSSFPGYFEEVDRSIRSNQPEEIHSPIFDHSRKLVPIGRNHQADVPMLRSKCAKDSSSTIDKDERPMLMGTCIVPMPVSCFSLGKDKTDCRCHDEGSVRCTRQHVMESREKLKKKLGQERFVELGFYDMGEMVVQRWTEKEQQLFVEVVAYNPASLGKNFWDVLPRAFPSRSSKELVSYYFNVFMLRKRAGQNREDPSNADSDDDEWQETEVCEFATPDSGVEFPDEMERYCGGHSDGTSAGDEGDDDEECYSLSEGCINDSRFTFKSQGSEEQDVQDGSCTSFESQQDAVDDFVETQNSMEYGNYGLSSMSEHGYLGGHCDPVTWENSYMPWMKKDEDLLPTYNVIEEFGKGSWE